MVVELKLCEEMQLSGRTSGKFVCGHSEDGRIFVLTTTGVFVLQLQGYVTNQLQQFSFRKEFFTLTDYTPSENVQLTIDNIMEDLTKEQIYETVFRVDLSGHIDGAAKIEPRPVCALWSSRGIYLKTDCVLGVLSNLYCLEIFVKHIDRNEIVTYKPVVNISRVICSCFASDWSEISSRNSQDIYTEFRRRVDDVTPTAFTWGHIFKKNSDENNCLILFVGHLNGNVSAWRIGAINSIDQPIQVDFVGKHPLAVGKITQLNWYKTKKTEGALTVADESGAVRTMTVSNLKGDILNFSATTELWSECDRINVNFIRVTEHRNVTYLFMVKERFLVIFAIDRRGEVFSEKILDVSNLYITGIETFENQVYLITVDGTIKKITVGCDDGNERITTQETDVNVKIDSKKFNSVGLAVSRNEVLFGVVLTPRRFSLSTKGRRFIGVHFFKNANKNPFEILLGNESGSLRDYWDCFEVLRVDCIKEKKFPWHGINPETNYDTLSLCQLKTLRQISKMSEKVYQFVPFIKTYDIKPYVLLNYMVDIKMAAQRMRQLLKLRSEGEDLSLFQMRSLDLSNFFLKEMVLKDVILKAELGKTFIDEVFEVMRVANELRYPDMPQCFWCGEKIIGPSCVPPHADTRCSISLMPILFSPGYKCPFCKCLAHKQLEKEYDAIFCPYCDVPMHGRSFPIGGTKIGRLKDEHFRTGFAESPPDAIFSVCGDSDALAELEGLEEIEENTTEYLIVSGSEEEAEKEEGEVESLRELYFKAALNDVDDVAESAVFGGTNREMVVGDVDDESGGLSPKQEVIL